MALNFDGLHSTVANGTDQRKAKRRSTKSSYSGRLKMSLCFVFTEAKNEVLHLYSKDIPLFGPPASTISGVAADAYNPASSAAEMPPMVR